MTFNKFLFVFSIVFASIQSCLCTTPILFCLEAYQGGSHHDFIENIYINRNFANYSRYSKIYQCDTNEHIATTYVDTNFSLLQSNSPFFSDEDKSIGWLLHLSCTCKKKDFCEPSGFTLPLNDTHSSDHNVPKNFLEDFNPGRMYAVCADTLDAPNNNSDKDEELSVGAIVGISVGSFVFVCLLVYVIRHKIKTGYWPFMTKEIVPDIKIEMKGLIF